MMMMRNDHYLQIVFRDMQCFTFIYKQQCKHFTNVIVIMNDSRERQTTPFW